MSRKPYTPRVQMKERRFSNGGVVSSRFTVAPPTSSVTPASETGAEHEQLGD